jgi:hypothetical protein
MVPEGDHSNSGSAGLTRVFVFKGYKQGYRNRPLINRRHGLIVDIYQPAISLFQYGGFLIEF